MKFISGFFILLFLVSANGTNPRGNPAYNFPDSIIFKFKDRPEKMGWLINELAISGYHREAKMYEAIESPDGNVVYMDLSQIELKSVTETILEEARHHNIVMFNESHIRPEHRLFVKSFLKGLYQQGYRVLMVEGLQQKNGLDSNKCPVSEDGHFINEPNYAQLLRYALKLGYAVPSYSYYVSDKWDDSVILDKYGSVKYLSYDPSDSLIKIYDKNGLKETIFTDNREAGMANNAFKIIKKNAPDKIVMMVGEGHINELHGRLGERLKVLMKEDILTIEQTVLSDRSIIADTLLKDTLRAIKPSFIWDKRSNKTYKSKNPYNHVDYSLVNAIIKDSLGRPGYLYNDVEPRKIYFLPGKSVGNKPSVFAAYYADEFKKFGEQAIAVDIVHIKDVQQRIPLLLYPAVYKIVKRNTEGTFEVYDVKIK